MELKEPKETIFKRIKNMLKACLVFLLSFTQTEGELNALRQKKKGKELGYLTVKNVPTTTFEDNEMYQDDSDEENPDSVSVSLYSSLNSSSDFILEAI